MLKQAGLERDQAYINANVIYGKDKTGISIFNHSGLWRVTNSTQGTGGNGATASKKMEQLLQINCGFEAIF